MTLVSFRAGIFFQIIILFYSFFWFNSRWLIWRSRGHFYLWLSYYLFISLCLLGLLCWSIGIIWSAWRYLILLLIRSRTSSALDVTFTSTLYAIIVISGFGSIRYYLSLNLRATSGFWLVYTFQYLVQKIVCYVDILLLLILYQ